MSRYITNKFKSLYTVFDGLVDDPFRESDEMFYLYKNPNNQDWMWLNSTTGDLVYM